MAWSANGLSDVYLYCKKAKLVLHFTSVTEDLKVGKERLAMMLRESADPIVRDFQKALKTGRKWIIIATESAKQSLQLDEVDSRNPTNNVSARARLRDGARR